MSEPKSQQQPARDWEKIELDYRAGVKTLRQIADEHGISHVAINKRAKRDGWERDLSAKIKAKADALVTRDAVTSAVTKIDEAETVKANARAIADIRLAQRKDISRSRQIVMALLAELEQSAGDDAVVLLEQLGDLMQAGAADKLDAVYRKIISLPSRAKTMRDLAGSLELLVRLERRAFGLDDNEGGGGQAGNDRAMTDTERAVRLVRLMQSSSEMLSRLTSREDIP